MASKEYLVDKILKKNGNCYLIKWSKFAQPTEVLLKDLNCYRALAEFEVQSALKFKSNLPPYKQILVTSTCVVVEW